MHDTGDVPRETVPGTRLQPSNGSGAPNVTTFRVGGDAYLVFEPAVVVRRVGVCHLIKTTRGTRQASKIWS
jgi:hypothetical protein